jgi:DHA3 family macrolide efflux protein-like MFS transporter
MIYAGIIISVLTIALGFAGHLWVYLVIMSLIGLSIPTFSTPAAVLMQEKVESMYLGRVFGVFSMVSSSMMPLGMAVFGPMADRTNIEWIMIGTGALLLITTLRMLLNKSFIREGVRLAK